MTPIIGRTYRIGPVRQATLFGSEHVTADAWTGILVRVIRGKVYDGHALVAYGAREIIIPASRLEALPVAEQTAFMF